MPDGVVPDEEVEDGPCAMLLVVPPRKPAGSSYLLSAGDSLPKWQRNHVSRIALRGRQFGACLYIDWKYDVQLVESFLMDLDFQSCGEMKANFPFDGLLGGLQ